MQHEPRPIRHMRPHTLKLRLQAHDAVLDLMPRQRGRFDGVHARQRPLRRDADTHVHVEEGRGVVVWERHVAVVERESGGPGNAGADERFEGAQGPEGAG